MQVVGKRAYKLNLSGLHAVCEANYARLLRLFPDYETCNGREFVLDSARVTMEVTERCRYTTFFRLQQQSDTTLLGHLRIDVRVYHDARMLEVGTFQSHRRIDARYEYPNKGMYQQDEKSQQNQFLADWLEHCQCSGRATPSVTFNESSS